jgi:aminoglycoside phosphotransferase family enzyme/predicted kinase
MDVSPPDWHHRLVRGLCRPDAWPAPAPTTFEVLETHLSSVVLAGPYAVKLKKPLALDFVDFSTLERRHHYCREELRLNQRTAAAWYVDVLPVTGTPDAPRVGGPGEPIEWALRMRRFDQALLLDRMAARGELTGAHADALARTIAAFHAALSASPAAYGDPAMALRFARANLHTLAASGLEPDAVEALRAWTETRFEAIAPAMARRRALGFVREGHGDLHLGNIAWLDGAPVPFDALEFDPSLRHLDVLGDAAFAFMDLLDHGLPGLAWRWFSGYLEHGGDYLGLPLWRWFAVYRALVRAKVAAIRAGQADTLAGALARPRAPALLVMTTGVSGSGKSTVARRLVEALGGVGVRSDVERKRLHGMAATARPDAKAGLYERAATVRTYARLADVARAALQGGVTLVVDAAFLRRDERDAMRALARTLGTRCVTVECAAPEAVLHERLTRRAQSNADASDATVEVLRMQLRSRDPLAPDEGAIVLDTDRPLAELAARVDALAAGLLRP